MTNETPEVKNEVPAVEKKATKKATPKAAAKKATKKAAPAAKAPAEKAAPDSNKALGSTRGLGKPRLAILGALNKADAGLTRSELSEKTGITSGWCGILGHLDPEKLEETSLVAKLMVKVALDEERGNVYKITAAGKKALANG